MSAFARGFRSRNPLVLVLALVLVVPALIAIESVFVSGAWTLIPMHAWIRNLGDGPMYVSWNTAELKRDPPKLPLVALTGGSGGRECIWSGPALAADVRRAGGPLVVGRNLSSPKQTLGETLAITETLPDTPTTLLVGLNVGRFTSPLDENLQQVVARRLLLKSDTLRRFAVDRYGEYRCSPLILPGIFQAMTTWAQKRVDMLHLTLRHPVYYAHTFDLRESRHPQTEKQKAAVRRKLATLPDTYAAPIHRNLAFQTALLDAIVRVGKRRGLDVVLLELPHNPLASGAKYREAVATYQAATAAVAAKYDVPYVDFNDELRFTGDDFYDFSHLRPAARSIWQRRLAEELVRLYDDGTIDDGRP